MSALAHARAVAAALRTLFPATPLQHNAWLSGRFGAEIWLKREDLSPVRSYKVRGAFNAMSRALAGPDAPNRFVCASAGNHAQGMAYACRHFGVDGVVFMPVTTPQQKIDKTRQFGGDRVEIVLTGDTFDAALAEARAHADATGARFLPPFDDADVIAGQASVAAEIVDAAPFRPDLVVIPVGGGGLSAGMVPVLRERWPGLTISLVEPAGGACLAAAMAAGHPVSLPRVDNFVDGAAVARIGDRTFAILRDLPGPVITVAEDRICTTMLDMLTVEGMVLEPAGALAIDALGDLDIAGRRVIAVVSGGNFDFERLPEVKERALRWSGRKKYLILRLPQRPGALREFLDLLGPEDDITCFEYLKKSARNFGSVLIGIEALGTPDFDGLFRRIEAAGLSFQDITDDPVVTNLVV